MVWSTFNPSRGGLILRSTLQGLLYSTLNPSGYGLDCGTRVYINHSKGGLRRRARGSRARYCISATTCHFPFRLGRPIHCSCSGSSILLVRLRLSSPQREALPQFGELVPLSGPAIPLSTPRSSSPDRDGSPHQPSKGPPAPSLPG